MRTDAKAAVARFVTTNRDDVDTVGACGGAACAVRPTALATSFAAYSASASARAALAPLGSPAAASTRLNARQASAWSSTRSVPAATATASLAMAVALSN